MKFITKIALILLLLTLAGCVDFSSTSSHNHRNIYFSNQSNHEISIQQKNSANKIYTLAPDKSIELEEADVSISFWGEYTPHNSINSYEGGTGKFRNPKSTSFVFYDLYSKLQIQIDDEDIDGPLNIIQSGQEDKLVSELHYGLTITSELLNLDPMLIHYKTSETDHSFNYYKFPYASETFNYSLTTEGTFKKIILNTTSLEEKRSFSVRISALFNSNTTVSRCSLYLTPQTARSLSFEVIPFISYKIELLLNSSPYSTVIVDEFSPDENIMTVLH